MNKCLKPYITVLTNKQQQGMIIYKVNTLIAVSQEKTQLEKIAVVNSIFPFGSIVIKYDRLICHLDNNYEALWVAVRNQNHTNFVYE